VWHCLALVIGFYLMAYAIARYANSPMDWGGVDWVRSTVLAALLAAMAVAILLLQYARRNTRVSRCILAAVPLTLVFGVWAPGWHAAFALQARIGPHHANTSDIHLSFDPARTPHTTPQGGAFWGNQRIPSSFLPVRVTGVPTGTELYSDHAAVTLTTSDGRAWTSGWDSLQDKLTRFTSTESTGLREEQFLTSGDECWQYVNIDPAFYAALRAPVRMHITWALTLFSQPEVTTLGRRARSVPGGGSCWDDMTVSCLWPGQAPQVNSVHVRSIPTGVFTDFPMSSWLSSSLVASYGPIPSTVSFWQAANQGGYTQVPPPTEVSVRSRRAIAHFERDLDVRIDDSVWRRFCP
jgi:hypothetical protein